MSPRIPIIIPTRNAGPMLDDVLSAIAGQAGRFEPEIVAIDSGSTDGTVDRLEAQRRDGPRAFSLDEFNHGQTRNDALKAVDGDFAVLLVQDAIPASPTWLSALVQPLLDDPAVAGTFARQVPTHGRAASRHTTSRSGSRRDRSRARSVRSRPEAFAGMSPPDRHAICAFDNVCSCIRISVWNDHPFAATPIGEDLEWARDVLLAGHKLAYVPGAVVEHSHERSICVRTAADLSRPSAPGSVVWFVDGADDRLTGALDRGDGSGQREYGGARAARACSARFCAAPRSASRSRSASTSARARRARGASCCRPAGSECESFRSSTGFRLPQMAGPRSTLAISRRRCAGSGDEVAVLTRHADASRSRALRCSSVDARWPSRFSASTIRSIRASRSRRATRILLIEHIAGQRARRLAAGHRPCSAFDLSVDRNSAAGRAAGHAGGDDAQRLLADVPSRPAGRSGGPSLQRSRAGRMRGVPAPGSAGERVGLSLCQAAARRAGCRASRLWSTSSRTPGTPPRPSDRMRAATLARLRHMQAAVADVDLFLAPSDDAGCAVFRVWNSRGSPRALQPGHCADALSKSPALIVESLRLGFVGGLLPTKGADVLLDAVDRLPAGSVALDFLGGHGAYHGETEFAALDQGPPGSSGDQKDGCHLARPHGRRARRSRCAGRPVDLDRERAFHHPGSVRGRVSLSWRPISAGWRRWFDTASMGCCFQPAMLKRWRWR